jgi:hypothetical protein
VAPAAPELPFELEYLWKLFLRLSRKRQSGMGPLPIASEEIKNWCALRRISLEPFECDILDQLDDLYLSHQYKKDK